MALPEFLQCRRNAEDNGKDADPSSVNYQCCHSRPFWETSKSPPKSFHYCPHPITNRNPGSLGMLDQDSGEFEQLQVFFCQSIHFIAGGGGDHLTDINLSGGHRESWTGVRTS
ncbi:unnamed protein product, partial [Allacma fusca]